ncbi:hypothetical protein EDD27_7008 [Nonomuraea polychroma]|uniref:Uncharacterized protein n=1 Tax=Nonomuraea polychroma TaxID=46176 RepID=A0A438MFA0_9ACTN|nr:hypothetical protein [Nonomuraea polychroma]RVX44278.1 hypothetical protein EDD27_7008 [Nonomuraea polychroma]
MTTVNEHTIAEELRRMAGEARPVDPHSYAARATARSSQRRRLSWTLAAACAVLVAGVVVSSLGGEPMTAKVATPPAPELPPNTPRQLQAVRACMPAGGPSVNVNPDWRDPAHGTVADFRVLAEHRDKNGYTALVGSTKGFVLCTPSAETPDPPVFTYWGNKAPGNLASATDPLIVDRYTVQYWWAPDPKSQDNYVRVVAGRVGSSVRRVVIDWSAGKPTDAVVSNGFFIARTPAGTVSRKDQHGEMADYVDTPRVTVTAYDAAGKVLGRAPYVPFDWRGPVT